MDQVADFSKEEEIETIFNAAPDAVIVINQQGSITRWNPKAEILFGWTTDEAVGKCLTETIIPHRYREAHQRGLKHFLATGEGPVLGRTIEIQALNKNDLEFDISLSISPALVQGKRLFVSFIRDITEQKKAEEEIRKLNAELERRVLERTDELYKSERRYRHLFENNPMPMWVIHLETFKFLDVNEAAIIHYGYSREEFLGMTALDIRPEGEIGLFKNADHSANIRPANYNRGIWRHLKKDGTIIHVEVIAHDISFEGKTARFILSNDITERKEAERALRESQALLLAIVDNSAAVIYVKDLQGRYLLANQLFSELFHLSKDSIPGKTDYDIFPREVADAFRAMDVRVAIADRTLKEEETAPQDDGLHTYISVKSTLRDSKGKPYAVFGISTDITELKEIEENLIKSLKEASDYKFALDKLNEELEERIALRTIQLEAANKEMEAFTYSVSHDLRSPLRGIIGFTSVLEDDYSSKLDDEARRITSIIKNNALKMGHLIDDLLAFSRMGRQDMAKTGINTQSLVKEVIDELSVDTQKSIEWEVHLLPPIRGEINTMRQVWVNLISNAIKYSGRRDRPRIEIGHFIHEKQIAFFIKDNGVGFDNKYRDKLFKVFQRLHSAHEFEGTGVGLALVDKIISKHGGKAWAEAEVNKGACFYFSLPAH